MTHPLATAIAWRVGALFVASAAFWTIKTIAIAYGADPYWVGRWIGGADMLVFIAIVWRWVPYSLVPKDAQRS